MVMVQTASGERVQGSFSSSSTLWDMLTELLQDHPSVMVASEGTTPAIVYMRQQVVGKEKLSTTSLKSLGVSSGRVSMRLISVKADNPQERSKPSEQISISDVSDSSLSVSKKKEEEEKEQEKEDMNVSADKTEEEEEEEEPVKTKPTSCHGDTTFPVLPFSIFPDNIEPMEVDMPTDENDTPTAQMEDTPTNIMDTPTTCNLIDTRTGTPDNQPSCTLIDCM